MKYQKHENQIFAKLNLILQKVKILNIFKYIIYYFDRIICVFFKTQKKGKNKKKQILLLANLGLGDAIIYLSVANKYRQMYPKDKYEITMYVGNHLDKLFIQETDFDNVELISFNEITLNLIRRIKLIKKIREKYYDIVIDPMGVTGCTPSLYLMASCCAEKKISIINNAYSICPQFFREKVYTKLIEVDKKEITNIEYYYYLINKLLKTKDETIEFYEIKNTDLKIKLPENFYIVFPSASTDIKKWEFEKYGQLIDKIYNKTKMPVIFCGTNTDRRDVEEVIKNIKTAKYINLLGKSSVMEFIEIIKRAKFVISNDTSAFHIALSQQVSVAIIAGGYTYSGFVTYDFKGNTYKKPYIIVDKRDCFNCNCNCKYLEKNQKKWPCLEAITVDYAWNIVNKMIDENINL